MGVAGSGKTTVGERLAHRLRTRFVDADDLHPRANIDKMEAGTPLEDADRLPWLRRVRDVVGSSCSIVVSCSALTRAYRDLLREAGGVTFVFLDVEPGVVGDRVAGRTGHFMGVDMVESQFAVLERPDPTEHDVITVDADRAVDDVVDAVVEAAGGTTDP